MSDRRTVWIEVDIRAATEKAIMFMNLKDKEAWIPKSQVLDQDEPGELVAGLTIEIEISEEVAVEKDLV